MKKVLAFLFFIGIFGYIKSQTLTFSDLSYVRSHSLIESQDYLALKGYDFVGKSEFDLPACNNYAFGKEVNGKGVQIQIVVNEPTKKIVQVGAYFSDKLNSIAIKNKVKTLGYSKSNESNNLSALEEKYIKDKSAVIFGTDKNESFGVYYSITYW